MKVKNTPRRKNYHTFLDNSDIPRGKDLAGKLIETQAVIRKAIEMNAPSGHPLVINFSGGRDSLLLVDIVSAMTGDFIVFFMESGIDFPGLREKVANTAAQYHLRFYYSTPHDYRGDFWDRIAVMQRFPGVKTTWCSRDLKFRPQKRVLVREFGKGPFYKLNGVRRFESIRRHGMYRATDYFIKDYHAPGDIAVYPIMNWTTSERNKYLENKHIVVETNELYERFGVSGCYYCPFYQASIYRKILRWNPHLYDKFIEWEQKLRAPALNGFKYLSSLRADVLTPSLFNYMKDD